MGLMNRFISLVRRVFTPFGNYMVCVGTATYPLNAIVDGRCSNIAHTADCVYHITRLDYG